MILPIKCGAWRKDYAALCANASSHRRGDDDALGKPEFGIFYYESADFANHKNPFGTRHCRNGGNFNHAS